MKAPKTLPRPANWQDFETLCMKLWGEIWNIPDEIQRHGRSGQEQHGVDIFGIPEGEDQYYGIQCKGKTEYSKHAQLTTKEIVDEIEKAKSFSPALKKLYFATTAQNDAAVQQFVREKNIENRRNGLFEIHVFGWESIVDKIFENKHTYNWYVNSQQFDLSHRVSITFADGSTQMDASPKFMKTIQIAPPKQVATMPQMKRMINMVEDAGKIFTNGPNFGGNRINRSLIECCIRIHNTGTSALEDCKLIVAIEGDADSIDDSNDDYILRSAIKSNIDVDELQMKVTIAPSRRVLVGDEVLNAAPFYIRPAHTANQITLQWKFLARDFKEEGQLLVKVKPRIEINRVTVLHGDPSKETIEEGPVEDYWENKMMSER